MASLSAAAPFQGATESYSAEIFSLDRPVPDSNGFFDYSDLTSVNSDASKALALDSGLDSESNSKSNSGIPETSNSNSNKAMFDLNNPGSTTNLDEQISSVPFISAPLVLAPDSGILEVNSNIVENPATMDPEISMDNPLIIAQNTGAMCYASIDSCPNPDFYIRPPRNNVQVDDEVEYTRRQVENNDAVQARDEQYLDDHPELRWDLDFRRICRGYSNIWRRVLTLCCLGPETAFLGFEGLFIRITHEGNCVTFSPERPRCADTDDRFCCEAIGRSMRWGWEGFNCVPAH
ncbi:hypothetical protein MMC29_004373 [Sticta canariensis]|nr:hypothetical protein [Sticta canariensis]